MKIKFTKTFQEEVDLPKYFKLKNTDRYFMLLDNETCLMVRNHISDFDKEIGLYPSITKDKTKFHANAIQAMGVTEVSESEFKLTFIQVCIELEKISN